MVPEMHYCEHSKLNSISIIEYLRRSQSLNGFVQSFVDSFE